MTVTVDELARECGVPEEDVLALVDQLTTLDGSEEVVAGDDHGVTRLTAQAAATIREQLTA